MSTRRGGQTQPEGLQLEGHTNFNNINSPSRKLLILLAFKLTTKPLWSWRKALWIKFKNKFIVSWSKCEIVSKLGEFDFVHYCSVDSDFKQAAGIGDMNPFTVNSHLFLKRQDHHIHSRKQLKSTQSYSWNTFWLHEYVKMQSNLDIRINFASWNILLSVKTPRANWPSFCVRREQLCTLSHMKTLL